MKRMIMMAAAAMIAAFSASAENVAFSTLAESTVTAIDESFVAENSVISVTEDVLAETSPVSAETEATADQDFKSIYMKYSDLEGVSAVFISPAMFRQIGKLPGLTIEGEGGPVDLAPLISSMTGFYLLSAEDEKMAEKLTQEFKNCLKRGSYELLVEAKDSGDIVRIYSTGNDKKVTSLMIFMNDSPDTTVICLDGEMNRSDLDELIAKSLGD